MATAMHVRVGTSGYSYKEWKGPFYPKDLPAGEFLRFYAARLPTVEINNTFYRMPTAKLALGWCADVPEDFTFAVRPRNASRTWRSSRAPKTPSRPSSKPSRRWV